MNQQTESHWVINQNHPLAHKPELFEFAKNFLDSLKNPVRVSDIALKYQNRINSPVIDSIFASVLDFSTFATHASMLNQVLVFEDIVTDCIELLERESDHADLYIRIPQNGIQTRLLGFSVVMEQPNVDKLRMDKEIFRLFIGNIEKQMIEAIARMFVRVPDEYNMLLNFSGLFGSAIATNPMVWPMFSLDDPRVKIHIHMPVEMSGIKPTSYVPVDKATLIKMFENVDAVINDNVSRERALEAKIEHIKLYLKGSQMQMDINDAESMQKGSNIVMLLSHMLRKSGI